jgi:hypothetical protein
MNPAVKNFITVFLKQAVIGGSTTVSAIWQAPATFNLSSLHGWEHVGLLMLGAVGAREAMVWGPKLLAWANS